MIIPILTFIAYLLKKRGWSITEKIIELGIVCLYQTTILNA
jgi:hypothetical protein